jgi:hypothetical protein
MKKVIFLITILAVISSCTPPEVGYISDNIHALEDTIFVPRGVFLVSAAPASEGSTYPLTWKFSDIKNSSGASTNDLLDEHEILIWKKAFNGLTDTTLALAEAKLELANRPAVLLNEVSGQMAFTQATKYVTGDGIYKVDATVSNVRGERQLNDYVVIKLQPFKAVEFPVEMRSALQLGKAGNAWDMALISAILNDFDNKVPSVLNGTHPYISITKTSDEPALGVKVKMIIADGNGDPISPAKVAFYPSGATFLQNFHDNSVETTTDATGTFFSLPAPPFPQFGRTYATGNNSYLMYYLTTNDALTMDVAKWEAEQGPKDWTIYRDPVTSEIRTRGYIRWGIKINDSGTWELKMKIPYTIKK